VSTRIIKNVGSGLVAQTWTGILGLMALPIFARGLGAERYGLLALNLALISFAAVADLGVGRAASKYLAEDFERKETLRTHQFIGTAFTVTVVMGLFGTIVLSLITPLLVRFAFRIPPEMQREAVLAFWITGLGLLAVLLRILFDGVLAGHHRIAVLNVGNMVASTLRIGSSIAAILSGYSLLSVLIINVIVSYLHALGLWWYTANYFKGHLKIRPGWDRAIARQLLNLGLGATLSWILANIIFLYADRFMIAAFLPLALTGYYTMAFDIASRQAYVSNSVSQAYFPVFSGHAATSPEDFERSFLLATRAVAVGTTGLAMLLIVFSRVLLTYWVGSSFAFYGAPSLMVLAFAALLSCYASIPYTAIIAGAGQPSVCVRTYSIAIVIHVAVSLVLLRAWGIVGVAVAFALAYAYVLVALCIWLSKKVVHLRFWRLIKHCFLAPTVSATALGLVFRFFVEPRVHNLIEVCAAFVIGYLLYISCCAASAFSDDERDYFLNILRGGVRTGWRKSLSILGGEA
jgi:O-antigen/teichoic acid export membrane protein